MKYLTLLNRRALAAGLSLSILLAISAFTFAAAESPGENWAQSEFPCREPRFFCLACINA